MRRIEIGEENYPAALLDLRSPPRVLWAIGDLAALRAPVVAIVGTRKATPYGLRATREIAGALARAGACVASGMARGIDGTAHVAALEERGRTVAVLGTGVDVPYPVGHRPLHARIRAHGLLLSEAPPGAHAGPGSFPRRNRLIAAIASITIVVEAGEKSGALNTAGQALELGRTVAAVPGPIDSPQSVGSNRLLRDGATVIADIADVLQLAGLTPRGRRPDPEASSPAERAVWKALGDGALDVDTLTARSGLPARECLAAVTTLELSGAIECALTGEIRRRLG
ncbi:MAG TPA: DNA-processing protein DprA [Gemmatimonadaceae bacterium]|nr:DNA-processing protein DprA [Gemmatimonadaceae bacterium]